MYGPAGRGLNGGASQATLLVQDIQANSCIQVVKVVSREQRREQLAYTSSNERLWRLGRCRPAGQLTSEQLWRHRSYDDYVASCRVARKWTPPTLLFLGARGAGRLGMERQLLILYGSQTGTAQDVAEEVARQAEQYWIDARALPMDAVGAAALPAQRLVVFIMSTTGQGKLPARGHPRC